MQIKPSREVPGGARRASPGATHETECSGIVGRDDGEVGASAFGPEEAIRTGLSSPTRLCLTDPSCWFHSALLRQADACPPYRDRDNITEESFLYIMRIT